MARHAWQGLKNRDRRGSGHIDMLAMILADGARTLPEMLENFMAFPRRFGFFAEQRYHAADDLDRLASELGRDLRSMEERGWVESCAGRYSLTTLGRQAAEERLAALRRVGAGVRRLLEPTSVTRVGVAVHFLLAALKLPAGLLSGSAGLINDAADTLLDGLSSLLVYAGIRIRREREANGVLVVLMLATGALALLEAMRRLVQGNAPQADVLAFGAILISGLSCAALGSYQRYVGLRTASLALITQSIDSRNHLLVALGVSLGLIAARLGAEFVDGLIGVAVALLILKSGWETALDLLRSARGEMVDFSRYQPGIVHRLDEMRQAHLAEWMLYLVDGRIARSRTELIERCRQAFDFDRYPVLREVGLGGRQPSTERIARGLDEIERRGWIEGESVLQLTPAGRAQLARTTRRARRAGSTHLSAADHGGVG